MTCWPMAVPMRCRTSLPPDWGKGHPASEVPHPLSGLQHHSPRKLLGEVYSPPNLAGRILMEEIPGEHQVSVAGF